MSNINHSYIQIQSTNTPNFSSYIYFDIANISHCIHDVIIQINTGPITGVTGGSIALGLPSMSSAYKWFTQCTITNANNTLAQFDSQSNYIMNQIFTSYEDVQFLNVGAGRVNDLQQRYTMSNAVGGTTWMIPIKELFQQLRPEILNTNGALRISLLMDSLTNILNSGNLSGIGSVIINSASLLIKISKYTQELTNMKLAALIKQPLMKTYNSTNYQPFTVPANSTQTICALSNFIGQNVQFLYFVIKPTSLTKNLKNEFTKIIIIHLSMRTHYSVKNEESLGTINMAYS